MKTSTFKIQKPNDATAEEPFVTFSHLASCFASNETADDTLYLSHGFPSPREENLYETGYISKTFLKC